MCVCVCACVCVRACVCAVVYLASNLPLARPQGYVTPERESERASNRARGKGYTQVREKGNAQVH